MLSLETTYAERTAHKVRKLRESFFSIVELMAANLRSLLAAYDGILEWPRLDWPKDLPLSPAPAELARELRPHYEQAKLELGLGNGEDHE